MTFGPPIRIVLIAALAAGLGACTGHPLQPLDQASNVVVAYGAVDAHFCTDAPAPAQEKLKYLFILDHSASNQCGSLTTSGGVTTCGSSVPGDVANTDSNGSHRYGQLVNFVRNLTPNPNAPTSFAAIDFSDDATQVKNLSGFDPDANDFITQITADWVGGGTPAAPAPNDHGFTNYQGALTLALQLIKADAQAEAALLLTPPVKSSYVIIFVSDGVPTVAAGSGSLYTQTFTTDIQPAIDTILALKGDSTVGAQISNIVLNTAYYSGPTQVTAAVQLLGQMATEGNGLPLQFNSGANILYEQFAPPARQVRNQLVDVFLRNENATWWNGSFLPDSDGDGLPDMIEAQQASDPGVIDTDGNGVSDLVEYRTKGHACDAAGCAAAGRDQYAICAGFIAGTDATGRVTMASSANDGLNDCEKFVLNAIRTTYNTNGDLIPDQYAFIAGLPIIPGSLTAAFADPFLDGIQNYTKLKLGFPIGVSARSIGDDFRPRVVALDPEPSGDPTVDCYHYQVNTVAMSAEVNVLRVMIIQNSAAVQSKPYLKMARSAVSIERNVAYYNPGDFK